LGLLIALINKFTTIRKMKIFRLNIKRKVFVGLFLILSISSFAQMPNDGLMMSKGYICNVLNYSHNSWNHYWEGSYKRENANIGTLTNQNVMFMSAYGITNKINFMVGLPYVWTKSSEGQFAGQKGFQDLSIWLKVKALKVDVPLGTFSVMLTAGASTPVSNYIPDEMPFSIGNRSKTVSGRLIGYYKTEKGFYATVQSGYIYRNNISIARDAYQYDEKILNTNQVQIPNLIDVSGRLGFLNDNIQTEIFLDRYISLSGDNIRRNDMPFPTNAMSATTYGAFGKYTFITEKMGEFSVTAQISRVLVGANVGQTTSITLGIQHAFNLIKTKETTTIPIDKN